MRGHVGRIREFSSFTGDLAFFWVCEAAETSQVRPREGAFERAEGGLRSHRGYQHVRNPLFYVGVLVVQLVRYRFRANLE